MEKSHILWSEEEVINVNGKECLNLEASIRVYEAFKSEFEKIGKIISPEVSKNLFLVDSVIKMEEARKEMALAYMEELKKKEAIESESPVEETTEKVSEQKNKYEDVLQYFDDHYARKISQFAYSSRSLEILMDNPNFSHYTRLDWLRISNLLYDKYEKYDYVADLEDIEFLKQYIYYKVKHTGKLEIEDLKEEYHVLAIIRMLDPYCEHHHEPLPISNEELLKQVEEQSKKWSLTKALDYVVEYKKSKATVNKHWLEIESMLAKKLADTRELKVEKYQDVIDFYNKHYGISTTIHGYNCLVSLCFNKKFSHYSDEEWLEISKTISKYFHNYEHTEQLERDFSTFLLTRKIIETKDITAGGSIIPETFVGRLALINSYLKKNPDKLAEFQLELDAEEVVNQFTKTFGPDVDYKNLLEFINKFWKAEQLYCYDAIVEYLNNNIKETEEELENPEELEDPEELENPEEEETYTIIKRINKAKQTVKDHKKVVYAVLAGTGIISLLICTFVFGHNPISVISNCARAFKGLWASNPAFAPFFKRLGDLGAYFGAAFIGFKYSGKAIDEFIKDGKDGEDEEALEITEEELSLSGDDVESNDLDTLDGEESEVGEVEEPVEEVINLDDIADDFYDLDNLSATAFYSDDVKVYFEDSTQKGIK